MAAQLLRRGEGKVHEEGEPDKDEDDGERMPHDEPAWVASGLQRARRGGYLFLRCAQRLVEAVLVASLADPLDVDLLIPAVQIAEPVTGAVIDLQFVEELVRERRPRVPRLRDGRRQHPVHYGSGPEEVEENAGVRLTLELALALEHRVEPLRGRLQMNDGGGETRREFFGSRDAVEALDVLPREVQDLSLIANYHAALREGDGCNGFTPDNRLSKCVKGNRGVAPKYAIVGDSHAASLVFALSQSMVDIKESFIQYTRSGSAFVDGSPEAGSERRRAYAGRALPSMGSATSSEIFNCS